MKVMICDDEPIERIALQQILKQHIPELQVVGEAANGRQAILLAEQCHPDIITMDIKMPGINGLETIHEIQLRHPHVRFILVSAYDTFNYAREAIKLGVKDYILKPSKKEVIVESVRRVLREIEQERSSRQERLELLEQVAAMTPLVEKELVRELLFDTASAPTANLAKQLPERLPAGYVLTIWFKKPQDFDQSLYELLKSWDRVWVGSCRDGCMPVIVWKPAGTSSNSASLRSEVDLLAQKCAKLAPGQAFHLTVGRVVDDYTRLAESYREALLTRHCMNEEQTVGFYEEYAAQQQRLVVSIDGFTRQIIEKIKEGNETEVFQIYALMLEAMRRQSGNRLTNVRDALLSFVAVIGHVFHDVRTIPPVQSWSGDWTVMETQLEDYLRHLTKHWAEINKDRSKQLAVMAMNYIQDRYTQDIRLEDVASYVRLSPSYFSRLFKEIYGITYIDVLTQIRIEEAKKRLGKGESVKEVAYSVGYNDPNYFTRIFKKVTGRSPRSYREQK
ncbi:response regulator [Effusibacillus lacus]|uniref:DNA-binding response regulator n=1 Tax=Effusibacillus lacus TaxID=1348429 RepID=A0A292YSD3_9BACL|nr:response regulator [Effusibacillus lacus]TCS75927.1 two-component system response regulator YesN [Effusibacillus lacus]GAX91683.1 DNA-binding response regulator [Effusibacillus lacus]